MEMAVLTRNLRVLKGLGGIDGKHGEDRVENDVRLCVVRSGALDKHILCCQADL